MVNVDKENLENLDIEKFHFSETHFKLFARVFLRRGHVAFSISFLPEKDFQKMVLVHQSLVIIPRNRQNQL